MNVVPAHDFGQLFHADLTIVVNVKKGKGLLYQEMWRTILEWMQVPWEVLDLPPPPCQPWPSLTFIWNIKIVQAYLPIAADCSVPVCPIWNSWFAFWGKEKQLPDSTIVQLLQKIGKFYTSLYFGTLPNNKKTVKFAPDWIEIFCTQTLIGVSDKYELWAPSSSLGFLIYSSEASKPIWVSSLHPRPQRNLLLG